MNNLSYMDKLLDGVEVKCLALGDIGKFIRGNGIQKKDLMEAGFPSVHYGQIFTRYGFSAVQSFTFISDELAKRSRIAQKSDLLIATTSENDEDVLKSIAWLGEKVAISGDMMLFRHDQNVKYLAYYFQTEGFQKQKIQFITGAKVRRVSRDSLAKMTILLPSLEIQAEIVRILDTFTSLVKELTVELISRKQQYSYYRDQLLTFEKDQVEWKTLDELVSFRRGSFPQPYGNSGWYDGENSMPFVQVADVSDFGFCLNKNTKQRISKLAQPKSVFVAEGTVIVSLQGTIGRVAITQYECYVDRTLAIFTDYKENINKKYFAYQLKNKFDVEKKYARGSTLKTITKAEFSKFEIPVPPLAEQERIIAILDKFDALTTSLTNGLPGELALRQQQYEYYRELLLSFPKHEVVDHD